jgi:hypothetical protein
MYLGLQSHLKATPWLPEGLGKSRERQSVGVAQDWCSESVLDNSSLNLPVPAERGKLESALRSGSLLLPFRAIASCNRVSTALILPQ